VKFPRRRILHLAAGAAALPAVSRLAWAQSYPTRPVRWLVGYPAGGPTDIIARIVTQYLSERLNQAFVIENRPGANSNVATEAVVRSPADGYTLIQITVSNAINATLYDNLNFDLVQDLAPVASINRGPGVMEVNPSFPAKTVPEFIAYAKANPGKINVATGPNGDPPHVYAELFKVMTGIKVVNVPYRGSAPAIVDLLGGQVQAMFNPMPSSIEHIKAGKLRALAVTTATRSDALPEVPTIGEFVSRYEASGWQGVAAPKNTPTEIVEKLNKEINTALSDSRMKARLADLGSMVLPGSPTDFGTLISNETQKWAKAVKFAGIKPD
jgi:tripartite-type tricarboxylate transporter receptor subunit TctC